MFMPNIIKIDLYNFELYRFKVGSFFETHCRFVLRQVTDTNTWTSNSALITSVVSCCQPAL